MPSGKVHDSINFFILFPTFFVCLLVFRLSYFDSFLFTASSFAAQFLLGPDLDIKSKQYKRWGLFRLLWLPYRLLLGHRSRFSHGLILGPIFRAVYFIFWVLVIVKTSDFLMYKYLHLDFGGYLLPQISIIIAKIKLTNLYSFICGYFAGAAVHTLTDKVSSFFKNLF